MRVKNALVYCLALLLMAGCGRKEKDEIKIGVVLPLTGSSSVHGKDILSGLNLALDEINKDGKKLKLLVEDDMSTTKGAVDAVNKLANNNIRIIIGPVASSNMLAMIPITEKNRIVLFSPAASSSKITNSGKFVFRNSLLAKPQTTFLVKYLVDSLLVKRIGVLYLNDETGLAYSSTFNDELSSRGGEIILSESFDRTAVDFRTILLKIRKNQVKYVFIAGTPVTTGIILKQAREMGLKADFFGTYGCEGVDLIKKAGITAEGFKYTSLPIKKEFIEKFKKKNNYYPTIGAPLGYDVLMILWRVLQNHELSSDTIKNNITKLGWYDGVTGNTLILPSGDADKEVIMKIVNKGEFTIYGK